jgi:membrane-associated phospholipid phosphatase
MLRRPRTALLGALACLVGLASTGLLSHLVDAARVRDTASLRGFASLDRFGLDSILTHVAHLADPVAYVVLGAGLVTLAFARGRRRLAMVLSAVLLLAPLTTEILKHLTAEPRGFVPAAASWPSGHATAAMALALCAVLVAPPRLRALVATVGGLFALGVSYAVLVLVWHFPSDVVGGYFVAAGWALCAVAVLRRWPDPIHLTPAEERASPVGQSAAIVLAGVSAIAATAIAVSRPSAIVDNSSSFLVAAVAIAALAAGLAAVLVHSARTS